MTTLRVATIAEVAERAAVSRQTVSNALNHPELLSPSTMQRVQAAIEELGYVPNRAARSLRIQSSQMIGLAMSPAQEFTANQVMDRFVHALVAATDRAGYHVLLFAGPAIDSSIGTETGDQQAMRGYEDLMRSTAVDAFVVTNTFLGNPQAALLRKRRQPFVAFGRPWDEPTAHHPWVDVDGAAGTDLATRHLLELGHTRIAWIGWHRDSWHGEDRRSGWSTALREAGHSTRGLASRVEDSVSSGRDASAVLLDEASPTAFVCASDTLAMGVIHTLAERGLRCGQDVAVVGFDDSEVAQVVHPGLTSVRQPIEEVADAVVKALQGVLDTPSVIAKPTLLRPTLAVRASSAG